MIDTTPVLEGEFFYPWCGTRHSRWICEIYSVTSSKNEHVTQTTPPFGWNFYHSEWDLPYSRSTYLPNLNSIASSIPEILKEVKTYLKGHVTQTTSLSGEIFLPAVGLALAVVDPLANLKECRFIRSREYSRGFKIHKRVT